jgi:asparagine N-glycosylation enzyme membrane subunit Stt3
LLVTIVGAVAAVFVGVSFGFLYHSPQGEVRTTVITLLASSTMVAILSFGYFRAYKPFTK